MAIRQHNVGQEMQANPHKSLEEFLESPGVDPLHLFVEAASLNLVDRLEEILAKYEVNVNAFSNQSNDRALPAACHDNSVKAVQWLLEHGADPNVMSGLNVSSLLETAQFGNVRIGHLLLEHGAYAQTIKESSGNSALYIAAQNGHKGMISLLLSHKADVNLTGDEHLKPVPPIIVAAVSVRPDVVAQLINAGAMFVPHLPYIHYQMDKTRRAGQTTISGYLRKITDKEMDLLQEVLDPRQALKLLSNPTYQKAAAEEKKGNYTQALKLLQQVPSSIAKAQIQLDMERNVEFIYGMKGSDARVSVWTPLAPTEEDEQPTLLQYNAWTRYGDSIYIHGGYNAMDLDRSENKPSLDEVWELKLESRTWKRLSTTGDSPGPRSGHVIFAHKDSLYVWGGVGPSGFADTKTYRLDLATCCWQAMKTKGASRPSNRENHAGVMYRGKFYMAGGETRVGGVSDEMWCLNMDNMKWTMLKPGKKRYCHKMWAAQGKVYILGGRDHDETGFYEWTIDDFDVFEIETKIWFELPICGDKPYDISEFCACPVYVQGNKDEPSAMIIWGGYSAYDIRNGEPSKAFCEARYGDEHNDFRIPYRRRLLRYDIQHNAWTLLNPTSEVLPKAQSYAAAIENRDGQIKLLIGGGYGFAPSNEKRGRVLDPRGLGDTFNQEAVSAETTATASSTVYEVSIVDTSDFCALKNDFTGKSWAWEFFDLGIQRPMIAIHISPLSPTLHQLIDLTHEDFQDPVCEIVKPADDETLLGVRVQLHGLSGRKDLNGAIGRCGLWVAESERYQVFLPTYDRGPTSIAVKPSNLRVANKVDAATMPELIGKRKGDDTATFPSLIFTHVQIISKDPRQKKTSPLECVFDVVKEKEPYMFSSDTYHGPVSRQAQAVLRTVVAKGAGKIYGGTLSLPLLPDEKWMEKVAPLKTLYERMKYQDSRRVVEFEEKLTQKEPASPEWLKLKVTLDGVQPKIEREIIVSPNIFMEELHSHVLAPCIGWDSNFHCYAFRRIPKDAVLLGPKGDLKEAMSMVANECWIGPTSSTAIDIVFQPLYIGGALASDKNITLGDLFEPNPDGAIYLQYVYDFGSWWSHTIQVTKYDEPVPKDVSVAYLLGGAGGCPPEDIGGIQKYGQIISQLCGKTTYDEEDENSIHDVYRMLTPMHAKFWAVVNTEIRAKSNMRGVRNPLDFSVEASRSELHRALRRNREKSSCANTNWSSFDCSTGLRQEPKARIQKKITDPTKFCAVCKVTVALELCSACRSIAFCCREHQLQSWAAHEAECKRIRKQRKRNR